MCIRDRLYDGHKEGRVLMTLKEATLRGIKNDSMVCSEKELGPVSYTHLRAHETVLDLVCRLLLEKKKNN